MKFTIGYPRVIDPSLIAILVDLQSMVIFDMDGELIGWIHHHTEHITFAKGYDEKLRILINQSRVCDRIKDYSVSFFEINGNSASRQWDIKIKFIYPPLPPEPITIATEDKY